MQAAICAVSFSCTWKRRAISVDDPRELADADHPVGRQVADVRAADDGRHVMLAKRLEGDVAQHHHLVVALDFLEGAPQVFARDRCAYPENQSP